MSSATTDAGPSGQASPQYSQSEWLAAAEIQPALPSDVPDWVRELADAAVDATVGADRSGAPGIFSDAARAVPDAGADGTPPRYSAVLVLLGEGDGQDADGAGPTVLLTHRNPKMRTHSGQIAFPGGRREGTDAGPVDTAVREAVEETGLDPTTVVPAAVLSPLYIDRTNHAVIPVLAWWRTPGPVRPATRESDWVRAYPVARLADPAARSRIGVFGWHGPAFDVDGYLLWGFTGGVVDALLQLADRAETWEEPWVDGEPVGVTNLFEALESSRNGENLVASALGNRLSGELDGDPDGDEK